LERGFEAAAFVASPDGQIGEVLRERAGVRLALWKEPLLRVPCKEALVLPGRHHAAPRAAHEGVRGIVLGGIPERARRAARVRALPAEARADHRDVRVRDGSELALPD